MLAPPDAVPAVPPLRVQARDTTGAGDVFIGAFAARCATDSDVVAALQQATRCAVDFNCLAVDIKANREFFEEYLGFRLTEQIVLDSGEEAGMWLTCTNKSYDFAYTKEAHGIPGRFHHITFALDSREEILPAADIFLEAGVPIETGPHKHAVQQTLRPAAGARWRSAA